MTPVIDLGPFLGGEASEGLGFYDQQGQRSALLDPVLHRAAQRRGNPPRHAPITAGEYFAAINRKNYDVTRA